MTISAKVTNVYNKSPLKAYASITINGAVTINGLRIISVGDENIVVMPSCKQPDGYYYDMAFATKSSVIKQINDTVIAEYLTPGASEEYKKTDISVYPKLRKTTKLGDNIKAVGEVKLSDGFVVSGIKIGITNGAPYIIFPQIAIDGKHHNLIEFPSLQFRDWFCSKVYQEYNVLTTQVICGNISHKDLTAMGGKFNYKSITDEKISEIVMRDLIDANIPHSICKTSKETVVSYLLTDTPKVKKICKQAAIQVYGASSVAK